MATKLTEFPAEAASRSGYSRYNWDEYLDGSAWELEAEKDFTVGTKSFRSAAAQAAKVKGGKVRTAVTKRTIKQGKTEVEKEFVILQFSKDTAPAIPAQVTAETAAESTKGSPASE